MSEPLEMDTENLRHPVYPGELDAIAQLPAVLTEVPVVPVEHIFPEEHVQTVLEAGLGGGDQALQVAEDVAEGILRPPHRGPVLQVRLALRQLLLVRDGQTQILEPLGRHGHFLAGEALDAALQLTFEQVCDQASVHRPVRLRECVPAAGGRCD